MSHVEAESRPSDVEQDRPAVTKQDGFEGVAMCAEAQADGVPCTELGRRCEECERVAQGTDPSAW